MLPKKLDIVTFNELKRIMNKINIKNPRVTIDFNKQTIESDEDYSVDDLLDSVGVLSPERVQELRKDILKSRED